MTADVLIVNIISSSYSGSTWVNLLLGAHSRMFSVGEIDRILRRGRAECALHGSDCHLWSTFNPASEQNLYLQIAQMAQASVLVVNNARYAMSAQQHPGLRQRFILLVRDGRAVVASDLRKHPGLTTWRAARSWATGMNKKRRMVRRYPQADVLTVCYEALRDRTQEQLERICRFLELPFEPEMLEYWTRVRHFIGGNAGSLSYLARAQGLDCVYRYAKDGTITATPLDKPVVAYTEAGRERQIDLSLYRNQLPGQFHDERWKSELSNWQLRLFALAAGLTNRRFGYPPSLDRKTTVGT